jgi:hypothetical protein
MADDFHVFNPTFVPSRLPTEVVLSVFDFLPDRDKLSMRILNKEWNALFSGVLDSRVFRIIYIRYTKKSYRNLEELSKDPIFSTYVTAIVHRTCLLPREGNIWRFFTSYL